MTRKQIKKPSSGKVSSPEMSLPSPAELLDYLDSGNWNNGISALTLLREFYGYDNLKNEFTPFKDETRIRNQDILDRIEYIMETDGFPYSVTENVGEFYLETKHMITGITLENLQAEFGNFFFNNPEFHIAKVYS